MKRATVSALFMLCLASGSTLTAQCTPFPRTMMTRLTSWTASSILKVGDANAGALGIAMYFAYDPSVGIAVQRTEHRHVRPDGKVQRFWFEHTPPPGTARGLWSALLRPLTADTPILVGPAEARAFDVWVDNTNSVRSAILSWTDIRPAAASTEHRFWFEILVSVDPAQPGRITFQSRMARLAGGGGPNKIETTMDEIEAPILFTQQPGDSRLARLLVPAALNMPVPATNIPLRAWQLISLSVDLEHPARGQQMQFSALYSGDATSVQVGDEVRSPFRKILCYATEDTTGYYKRFRHRVESDGNGLAYYRWAPVYFPSYGPSPSLNCFASEYPAVLSGLRARDDAFWFDVASLYREFVRRGMRLIPIRSANYPLNPEVAAGKSVLVAAINVLNPPKGIAAVFSKYVDHALDLQQAFAAPGTGAPAKVFMEWQKWIVGPSGSGLDLVGPNYNPRPFSGAEHAPLEIPVEARKEIARAQSKGVNISVYTLPLMINRDDWTHFLESWLLRTRLGATIPAAHGELVDFGLEPVPAWFSNSFFADILGSAPGLGGFYLDTVGGVGSFLRYAAQPAQLFTSRYHGGSAYVQGLQTMLDSLRAQVAKAQVNQSPPDKPFLPTEAVQEFYAGRYDAAQHGLKPLPWQTQTNGFIDQFAGLANPMPIEASNNNPPLWNAVYHEYSRAEALGMMLNVEAVSPAVGGGSNPPFPGLSWDQWGDYNRMVHALMFVQGMKASLFSYFYDLRAEALLQSGTNGPVLQNPSVPQQKELLAFMQRMHQAGARTNEAGAFLNSGVMERPLRLPHPTLIGALPFAAVVFPSGTVDVQISPAPSAFSLTAPLPGITRSFYEDFLTAGFPHTMIRVLHSVWRTAPEDNRLGLVLVNWTDEPANWQATFDPALYQGFVKDFRVLGVAPKGAGVETYLVGDRSGPTVLGYGGTSVGLPLVHHGQSGPGLMPPRSVQVFLIEPR